MRTPKSTEMGTEKGTKPEAWNRRKIGSRNWNQDLIRRLLNTSELLGKEYREEHQRV